MSVLKKLATSVALAGAVLGSPAFAQENVRIAIVVKALGIGFFEAAAEGAEEAAAELGNVEIIYTGLRLGEKLYEELLIGDDVI